jgi:hypothetical protein
MGAGSDVESDVGSVVGIDGRPVGMYMWQLQPSSDVVGHVTVEECGGRRGGLCGKMSRECKLHGAVAVGIIGGFAPSGVTGGRISGLAP